MVDMDDCVLKIMLIIIMIESHFRIIYSPTLKIETVKSDIR